MRHYVFKSDIDKALVEMVKEQRKKCPYMIDGLTKLSDIRYQDGTVFFTEEIMGISDDEILKSKNVFKAELLSRQAGNIESVKIFKMGFKYSYNIANEDGKIMFSIDINKNDFLVNNFNL